MTALADKQAQLAKLKSIKESGVHALRDGDRSSTFRSMAELTKAIADLEGEIAGLENKTKPRVRYVHQVTRAL